MRSLIKKLLNEIKFSQERSNELKDKFGWRFVQTQRPKSDKKYEKLHIYIHLKVLNTNIAYISKSINMIFI